MRLLTSGINENLLLQLKINFEEYIHLFHPKNKADFANITLKKEHSRRVSEIITDLGKSLNLEKDQINLLCIIGLFHDIGRFDQYTTYGTFADSKSVDHAQLGISILEQKDFFSSLPKEIKREIAFAIKNHNKASLPALDEKNSLFYLKILRDADKLDIFYLVEDYYKKEKIGQNRTIELDLPDIPAISQDVYQDIMNKEIVKMEHLKSLNDFKILQLGWIFDINLKKSFEIIRDNNYVEMIVNELPSNDKVKDLHHQVKTYLQKSCAESSNIP